jgi:hypothetical protein
VWNGRERTKWIYNPSREWSYVNSRLMENNFHVRFRALFSLRISPSLLCEFPSGELTTCGALSIQSLEPQENPPLPRTQSLF